VEETFHVNEEEITSEHVVTDADGDSFDDTFSEASADIEFDEIDNVEFDRKLNEELLNTDQAPYEKDVLPTASGSLNTKNVPLYPHHRFLLQPQAQRTPPLSSATRFPLLHWAKSSVVLTVPSTYGKRIPPTDLATILQCRD
jgi:hypothetical protein